jgi:hypothetical protein
MIIPLLRTKDIPDKCHINAGVLGWRWAIELEWFSITVGHQTLNRNGSWHGPTHHHYWRVGIDGPFHVENVRSFFDCPQRAVWLGWLNISWASNDWSDYVD